MCDRASYMKMTRGTNLKYVWPCIIHENDKRYQLDVCVTVHRTWKWREVPTWYMCDRASYMKMTRGSNLIYVWPWIIYENDERYQLDVLRMCIRASYMKMTRGSNLIYVWQCIIHENDERYQLDICVTVHHTWKWQEVPTWYMCDRASYMKMTRGTNLMYVWPCIIHENDKRYQLDICVTVHHTWKWREVPTWCMCDRASYMKMTRGTNLIYVWPCIIHENDERYQLDATIMIYYHK